MTLHEEVERAIKLLPLVVLDGATMRRLLQALSADLQRLREENARLRNALSLAESVYRQNCVAEGEPSSILDALRAALASCPERLKGEKRHG